MDTLVTLTALALTFAAPAIAAETPAAVSRIDPNTFIVGHPASPRWKRQHSNGAHPAVQVAARPAPQAPDSNGFLVLPPASVRWTTQPQQLLVAGVPH